MAGNQSIEFAVDLNCEDYSGVEILSPQKALADLYAYRDCLSDVTTIEHSTIVLLVDGAEKFTINPTSCSRLILAFVGNYRQLYDGGWFLVETPDEVQFLLISDGDLIRFCDIEDPNIEKVRVEHSHELQFPGLLRVDSEVTRFLKSSFKVNREHDISVDEWLLQFSNLGNDLFKLLLAANDWLLANKSNRTVYHESMGRIMRFVEDFPLVNREVDQYLSHVHGGQRDRADGEDRVGG